MLKIKDNVDLKELEKYDFCEYNEEQTIDRIKILYDKYCYKNFFLYITEDRRIYGEVCDYIRGTVMGQENFDTLYDLIKDDLVEKVKE
ncbi:MAG: hypothetical protein IKE89_03505 [Bacilli bacterium]|nr:hypothetical protein [Bacilli bacterium]MBR2711518.1 hypothetical protein [Bacilli bacterium]